MPGYDVAQDLGVRGGEYPVRPAEEAELEEMVAGVAEHGLQGRQIIQAENIAPATYAILVLVAANPGCLASEICAITAISSANIIPYIDELVERGLIRREIGARDRRVKHLYLTDEGAAHLVALRRLEKRVVAHFEKKLGAQSLSKLIEWLGILAEND